MSNIGRKIERLISDGFSYSTLRGLSEGQVNLLYKRLVEQSVDARKVDDLTSKVANLRTQISAAGEDMKKLGLAEDDTINIVDDPDATADGMGMMETEIQEKFESKSQQKFFWSKCKNAKSDKAKKNWCKWAKEFSDETPDFKSLPEKKKKDVKELEEGLTKLVEKYIPESITKGKLMSMIEQASAPAKPKEKERTTTKPNHPKYFG